MRKALLLALAACCLNIAAPKKPKLIVTIVLDQFRFDYLTRYRSEYTGGLHRLLTRGAVFTEANYIHVPTITAVGHSTILSGATPSVSGIIGNDWYDREEKAAVTSVSDKSTKLVGGALVNGQPQVGSSPARRRGKRLIAPHAAHGTCTTSVCSLTCSMPRNVSRLA